MKRYIRATLTPQEYNDKQTEVGSTLKTYKGSAIKRSSKYGVGKEIGGDIYFHKMYADEIIPADILDNAESILIEEYPNFQYNCIRYSPKTGDISFQEAPDFDTAREPKVGDYITVKPDGSVRTGHSEYIWHHKWCWVKNDYPGFDVSDSWEWSRQWLNTLQETSDGNGIGRWNAQLKRYGLPIAGCQSVSGRYIRSSKSNRWDEEFELERNNTTPKAFWRTVTKAMQSHGEDITDWIESYEQWSNPYQPAKYRENRQDGFIEAFRYEPYMFQLYYSSDFNVIMEFDFWDENRGYGYFYFASNQ